MLNAIRKQAGSWIVKILLLLLVVSFAIWGIGDIFYGGARNPAVAQVGDTEILASELNEEFNRVVENMQRRLGTTIDRQQAIQFGLMQQALQDMIARRLIDLRAREMGLTVADETLREMITNDPAFQTAGQFDRARFEQLLLANGLSEDSFLATLRQDVVRSTLTESLAAPVEVPDPLVEALYRHRHEKRRGRVLEVRTDLIKDVAEPGEEQLATYYEEHKQQYQAPEYRALTFITLEPEDLLDEVQVPEEEIAAIYEERRAMYRTPERHRTWQLLASDEETIKEAERRLAEGAGFEEVAQALADRGVTASELGEVAPGELPEELDEVIFDLQKGEVSAPVQSAFGWHIFRVDEIKPEETTPLAEVRDAISEELALEEARERLPALANSLDDELAAGASLEEAAERLGLEVKTTAAVDPAGLNERGEPLENLPEWPSFIEVAQTTPAGETSLLEETETGAYFVLRVDRVTPPRTKEVAEVREELVAAWQDEQRRRRAREKAQAYLEELGAGGLSLDQLAQREGIELQAIEPVERSQRELPGGLDPAIVRALFATEPGGFAKETIERSDGFAIVATDEVIGANPADDPEGVEQLEAELEAEMRSDVLVQLSAALRRDYPVEIDMAELGRLSRTDQPAGGVF